LINNYRLFAADISVYLQFLEGDNIQISFFHNM